MMPTPPPDNDAQALKELGLAVLWADVAYRLAPPAEQAELWQPLVDLFDAYLAARQKLLAGGVITTEDDLATMRQLREQIEQAANTTNLIRDILALTRFLPTLGALL